MVKLFVGVVVLALMAVAAGMWAFQRWGVYHFDREVATPESVGLAGARTVSFTSEDGTTTTAWLVEPEGDRPVIMSFHGGYSSIGPSAKRMEPLVERGYGLAMMQYRGSGEDRRHPSEAAFAMDARALYDQLDILFGRPVPAGRRVLHGMSLGTSVGGRLAADRPFAAVVLEATFPSVCRYFERRYSPFPFCRAMWSERNDIMSFVGRIDAPILFVHGERDESTPLEWAKEVYAAASDPKEMVVFAQGGHADLDRFGMIDAVDNFISTTLR